MAEEKLKALPMVTSSGVGGSSAAAAVVPDVVSAAVPAYPVSVVVEEKLRLASFIFSLHLLENLLDLFDCVAMSQFVLLLCTALTM
jgi:hypothetical protein